MSEQDTRATAEADQLEEAAREIFGCLIESARATPPALRVLALGALVLRLGQHAEEVLAAIDGGG